MGSRLSRRPRVTWMDGLNKEMQQEALKEREWENREELRRKIWSQHDAEHCKPAY